MIRKIICSIAVWAIPVILMAQEAGGQVKRPVKNQQTTTKTHAKKIISTKQDKAQQNGYNVTISCNVPSATMYIDGNHSGSANGMRFLKIGSHSIKLYAEGYDSLSETIQVDSKSRTFSLTMKKKAQKTDVIQNLVNNMVRVEGGTFTMGVDGGYFTNEEPAHRVTLSSFYIGKYEVTQEEWQAVMGYNPSYFKGSKLPVENVSWNQCLDFIRKLNSITGKLFRLPTEAEWEYAAKGGNRNFNCNYAGSDNIDRVAWYSGNYKNVNNSERYDISGPHTHNVGQKAPNDIGLYDMSGNVEEWCQDWYGSYDHDNQTNPSGPSSGNNRVVRGGGWCDFARSCRVSKRNDVHPRVAYNYIGLRIAL